MANYVQGQTKTSFVREVLREIGAVTDEPPVGWKKKVEEALAAHNLNMNQVTIYQTRLKLLRGGSAKKDSTKKGRPVGSTNAPKAVKTLQVEELIQIREFAKTIGGINRLSEGVKFIQAFNG